MNDQKFVDAIFSELFDENFCRYQDSLTKPTTGEQDSYGRARNALAFLNSAQRLDVVEFLREVIADTASVILGALDGVHFPDGLEGECVVSLDGVEIQGDLQDMFISKAQNLGIYD